MRVKFWGTRGSIPTPGPDTAHYGGNTSCVELRTGGEIFILDAGTGIRPLGEALQAEFGEDPIAASIFISHPHWDHIQGLPFFPPAYFSRNRFMIYGLRSQTRSLRDTLFSQMDLEYFPLAVEDIQATLEFHELEMSPLKIGAVSVTPIYANHPGIALAFRFEAGGKTLVYMSDNEPYKTTIAPGFSLQGHRDFVHRLEERFVEFARGADLLICDSQFTREEYEKKIGWGHSCIEDTTELALAANVRRLAFFHYDPMHSDREVEEMIRQCVEHLQSIGSIIEAFGAREGMTVEI